MAMKIHFPRLYSLNPAVSSLALIAVLVSACSEDDKLPPPIDNKPSPIRGGTWAEHAPIAQGPRLEAIAATIDNKIYLVGGFDSNVKVTSTIEVYDPAMDTWSTVAPLPEALHHANVAVVDGKIYVLGGALDFSFALSGKSYVYDPARDRWDTVASLPAGKERAAAGVGVHDGKIYLAGGGRANNTGVDSVLVYDTKTDQWAELPPLPSPRFHTVGAVVDGVFYVIGGIIFRPNQPLPSFFDDTLALDLAGGVWQKRASMPVALGGCAVGQRGNEILCISGVGDFSVNGGVPSEVLVYDTSADSWIVLPPMPKPRTAVAAAFIGDSFYMIGGAYVQRLEALDVNQSFTVNSGDK
jgi:N-acetylneuraminic acid mutarotase